jgi:hypothetical protein
MSQSVFNPGDPITSRLKLGVVPDGTTAASVVVRRPDGAVISGLTPSGWVNTDEKTVQFYATDDGAAAGTTVASSGDWLVVWSVLGAGASVTPKVYSVSALPGTTTRPVWSPFLSDVADHAPFLTMDTRTPGAQTWLGTFTGWTSPTDEQAQRHIDSAASIVGAGFGTLAGTLPRMARAVTALRAAISLIRAFARGPEDLALADALERQLAADTKALQAAVDNAGADTLSAAPVLYAPAPVPWGDDLIVGSSSRYPRTYLWPE